MMPSDELSPRILVIGCGGIGGVLASHLLMAQANLYIATTNKDVRHVWATTGPYLGEGPAIRPLPEDRILTSAAETTLLFDFVFVAVQPLQIVDVAKSIQGKLTERGRVICLPNGLCESRLSEVLGPERIVGAVVTWGARMPQPGHYLRTSKGGFAVGSFSETSEPELFVIRDLLLDVGPVRFTENLRGARFSKLVINCAVTALGTIGGRTLGKLLVRTKIRHLGLSLMREAVQVALADGVELESVNKIDIGKLVAESPSRRKLKKAAQHALLIALGARYRKLRSSMLSAIERGREPAIDYINGEIVSLGKIKGIPTPFNQAAVEIVWAISRRELAPGNGALEAMRQRAHELDSSKTEMEFPVDHQ